MRLGVIYKVTIGKWFIIGSTLTPKKRERDYKNGLRAGLWNNLMVQRVYNKYKSLTFNILQEKIPEDILLHLEDIWMGALHSKIQDKRFGMNTKDAYRPNMSKGAKDKIAIANGEAVYQYDLNGEFLKKWNSAKEASEFLKCQDSLICICCNGKRGKHANSMWFKNYQGEKTNPYKKKPNRFRKPILQKDKNGAIVSRFENLKEVKSAGFSMGNISSYLSGRRKVAYGYHWEYV